MDEYDIGSSESDREALTDSELGSHPVALQTPPGALPIGNNQFSMPNQMKPMSTPLMAIPATRMPIDESMIGQNQDRHEISVPTVPLALLSTGSLRKSSSSSKLEIISNGSQRATSGNIVNWSQGLLGDLTGSATNAFRRNTLQGERRDIEHGKAAVSRTSDLQPVLHIDTKLLSDEDEEDYWGGTLGLAAAHRSRRADQVRSVSYRDPTIPDEPISKNARRRTLTSHARNKSKSMMKKSVHGMDSPTIPSAIETTARSRGRSRSNSITQTGIDDLDAAARAHMLNLLQQMLQDAEVSDQDAWQQCLQPILTKVATYIQPKVKDGASGYINNYVKIKRISGSRPASCEYLSGAVFTHKLAHKKMSRSLRAPRIMLVAFPLEYHRADSSQLLSLEPVIAQEKEYLKNLVNRIMALRPNLILIQYSISGLALEYLLESNVTVAYMVKESAMAIVSGLTGADIITSIDRLAFQPRIGRCELFQVKTFAIHDDPRPYKKTYFYFRGCPADLGCSIVLRGGSMHILSKIKRIVELMVFVVYNLKLETSLIRDQFSIASATGSTNIDNPTRDFSNEALLQTSTQETLQIFQDRILSASSGVHFPAPYLVRKAADLDAKLMKHKAYQDYLQTEELLENPPEPIFFLTDRQQQEISDLTLDQQENIKKLMDAAEQRRLNQELQHCKSQWKTFLEREIRDHKSLAYPQDRQTISTLFSAVCSETGTPCTMPTTEVIGFYKDTANDWPLGQYIEDCVYMANRPCPTILCGRKNMDHHRSYVHAQARVSVITETYPCPLPGMQNTILMWNYCKKCDSATPLMPMSENSWGYSFGKYLEVTFYDRGLHVKSEQCKHDLCRDHVRYFGFRDMAIRFDYDPVEIMGLALPQSFVDWQPDTFVRLKNEEFKFIQFKITAFYDSLEFRLYNMNSETLVIEQIDAYKADIVQMRQKAKDERIYLLNLLQDIFENSAPLEYLCLNRALRATQDKVTSWNETFDEVERLYLPSEKDIRRLTAAHLKKLFSLDDASRTSIGDEDIHSDNEGKRSVSAPVVTLDLEQEMEPAELHIEKEIEQGNNASELASIERVVSMPSELALPDEEPRGFHPRRTYEQLVKGKLDHEGTNTVRTISEASEPVRSQPSSIPKPTMGPRTLSDESLPMRSSALVNRGSSRSPSIDLKYNTASSIPVLKTIQDPFHLRKKSLTNNHVLSKQIQDIGEHIVGSAEKRWAEQKKYSSPSKDHPQRNKAGETKVISLAKHFEQLTKEFEKERIRARRVLHSRGRSTFAVATQKPTVAVFDNVNDAVDELSDEEEPNLEPLLDSGGDSYHFSNPVTNDSTPFQTPLQVPASPKNFSTKDIPDHLLDEQQLRSTSEVHEISKDGHLSGHKRGEMDSSVSSLVPASERNTLMKTLSNFWADRSSSNWTPLEYPLPPSEHMFLESDVVVREDEPSSLIAFTLSAEEYISEISTLREAAKRKPMNVDQAAPAGLSLEDRRIRATMQNPTGTHMRFAWGGDKSSARLTSRIFFAEQFDALRRFCGCDENYITSLSRCVKWDSLGGKSGSAFLKTQDDRLIVKQLSKIETEQFLRFAPNYFEYMSDNFFNKLPVSLCKILGFYQITSKNPMTGRFMKMDVIVMENLFYKRKTSRIFDLKGSMRNRKVQQTGKENEVLLDENFVEREFSTWTLLIFLNLLTILLVVSENPLFVRDHARRFLKSALHNDTLFLAQNNVMDYSLIIGIDDERHELIVGIIDFIRTYTWDKKLESWVKERGLVGGGSTKPTVVTPKMYKTRFREAMDRYIFGIK